MAILPRGQVRCRPAAHAAPKQDHIALLDTAHMCEVVIDSISILFHLLLVWLARFVEAIARVLNSEDMHLHLGSKHVQQIERQADIFSISVEVKHYFVATIFAGEVQAWYILQCRVVLTLRIFLHFD